VRRLLINDCLSVLQGHRTFWHDLQEWFSAEFAGGDYAKLAENADSAADGAALIIRNASYFGPLKASGQVPTISLLQDIFEVGQPRTTQEHVIASSRRVVFNSAFTASKYPTEKGCIIPLPVDFRVFTLGNSMGCQQMLSLPDGAVCWVGASQGAAGQIKGWDIFLSIVRQNPDIPFVAVFKDAAPESAPPNMRCYARLAQDELAHVIGACRVGLCTSRSESQHLAGIEMGACGLPMVAPQVGIYWKRDDLPGIVVGETTVAAYTTAVRAARRQPGDPQAIRSYWQKEFDREVIKSQWVKLVEETECAGQS